MSELAALFGGFVYGTASLILTKHMKVSKKVTDSDIVNFYIVSRCSSVIMVIFHNYRTSYDNQINMSDLIRCVIISICGALVPICATKLYGEFYKKLKRDILADMHKILLILYIGTNIYKNQYGIIIQFCYV